MKNLTIDLTVNEKIGAMFYQYCKICNDENSTSEMNGILYDWQRVDTDRQTDIIYRLTFVSMKNVISFFYQLGRITEFEVLDAISLNN